MKEPVGLYAACFPVSDWGLGELSRHAALTSPTTFPLRLPANVAQHTTWMLQILKPLSRAGSDCLSTAPVWGVNTPRTNTRLTFEQVSLLIGGLPIITRAAAQPNKSGCPGNREGRSDMLNLLGLFWGGTGTHTHTVHQEVKITVYNNDKVNFVYSRRNSSSFNIYFICVT